MKKIIILSTLFILHSNAFSQKVDFNKYDEAEMFSDDIVKVKLNGKYGLISKAGKEITAIEFDDIRDLKEDMSPVKKDDKMGFLNNLGKLVVPFKYTVVDPFIKGKARVCIRQDGKLNYGFIDKTGKVIIPVKYYPLPHQLGDDFIIVLQNNKYAILDWNEKVIQPAIFSDINLYSDGMARVEIDGKYGFIDQKAQLVIPAIYQYAEYFENGFANVTLDYKSFKINKKGEVQ